MLREAASFSLVQSDSIPLHLKCLVLVSLLFVMNDVVIFFILYDCNVKSLSSLGHCLSFDLLWYSFYCNFYFSINQQREQASNNL